MRRGGGREVGSRETAAQKEAGWEGGRAQDLGLNCQKEVAMDREDK